MKKAPSREKEKQEKKGISVGTDGGGEGGTSGNWGGGATVGTEAEGHRNRRSVEEE
jgi:hypothetical protein